MKLLIVDDSAIIRMSIQRIITGLDIQIVGEAGDGVNALKLYQELKPDVVTMDITMPEMDGISCLEEILKFDPNASIIVVTSLQNESVALKAMMKGAKAVLHKPFKPEALKDQLFKIKS